MCRTDQAVMGFIANMRLVHTHLTIFGAIVLLLLMMMKSTPGNECYGKYPQHTNRKGLLNM